MTHYRHFIKTKTVADVPTGIQDHVRVSDKLFIFQSEIVQWALRRGRAAIWADCGLGKTAMQLEWAQHVPGPVLILAPLAVAHQTVREGEKFGVPVTYQRHPDGAPPKITITNYEMLENFDPSIYTGVVLDESSILKSYTGMFRNLIIESFAATPFRLACTATPAPNDYMELGNHSEFVGAMSRTEMLSMFFVHDGGETQKYRLKGHAESVFWKWVSSWAVMIRKPSDIGHSDDGFTLPPLEYHQHIIETPPAPGQLFAVQARTLQERIQARRLSIEARVDAVKSIVDPSKPHILWCNLNDESAALVSAIEGAVEITGSHSMDEKEKRLAAFADGGIRILVSKPSICGFGLNWQHCADMVFVGLSDSYEQLYQAVRRCWRFGQKSEVNAHIVVADTEGQVLENIARKDRDSEAMARMMTDNMASYAAIRGGIERDKAIYTPQEKILLPAWLEGVA